MDCSPALGPPCFHSEHNDQSAPIFNTAKDCCGTSLSWVNADSCMSVFGSCQDGIERSEKYFADYNSGSCFKDAAPCAEDSVTCAEVPPTVKFTVASRIGARTVNLGLILTSAPLHRM